jgi:hypothetical protein
MREMGFEGELLVSTGSPPGVALALGDIAPTCFKVTGRGGEGAQAFTAVADELHGADCFVVTRPPEKTDCGSSHQLTVMAAQGGDTTTGYVSSPARVVTKRREGCCVSSLGAVSESKGRPWRAGLESERVEWDALQADKGRGRTRGF